MKKKKVSTRLNLVEPNNSNMKYSFLDKEISIINLKVVIIPIYIYRENYRL